MLLLTCNLCNYFAIIQPGAKLQQARLIGASDAVNTRRELPLLRASVGDCYPPLTLENGTRRLRGGRHPARVIIILRFSEDILSGIVPFPLFLTVFTIPMHGTSHQNFPNAVDSGGFTQTQADLNRKPQVQCFQGIQPQIQ